MFLNKKPFKDGVWELINRNTWNKWCMINLLMHTCAQGDELMQQSNKDSYMNVGMKLTHVSYENSYCIHVDECHHNDESIKNMIK